MTTSIISDNSAFALEEARNESPGKGSVTSTMQQDHQRSSGTSSVNTELII